MLEYHDLKFDINQDELSLIQESCMLAHINQILEFSTKHHSWNSKDDTDKEKKDYQEFRDIILNLKRNLIYPITRVEVYERIVKFCIEKAIITNCFVGYNGLTGMWGVSLSELIDLGIISKMILPEWINIGTQFSYECGKCTILGINPSDYALLIPFRLWNNYGHTEYMSVWYSYSNMDQPIESEYPFCDSEFKLIK